MLSIADDDKTERILPDIEDNEEIESFTVRQTNRVENNKDVSMEVDEPVKAQETRSKSVICEQNTDNEVEEITDSDRLSYKKVSDKNEDACVDRESADEPQDLSISEVHSTSNKQPEVEHTNQLLDRVESELSNVELSQNEINSEKTIETRHDESSDNIDHVDKPEDDDTGSIFYNKETTEPIECKIIVSHEETDASSIVSSDPPHCDLEIKKITRSCQRHNHHSAPNSPTPKENIYRSLSRASLRFDLNRSHDNLCPYPIGFEATSLHDSLKDNYNDEDMELEEPQHHAYMKHKGGLIVERTRSHASLSTSISGVSLLKARCSKIPGSPASLQSGSSYDGMEEDDEDSDAVSCGSYHSNEKDDEEDDDYLLASASRSIKREINCEDKKNLDCKGLLAAEILQRQQQDQPMDFRSQSLMSQHYSSSHFSVEHRGHSIAQHQETTSIHQESYTVSNSGTSQNILSVSESADPTTSTDSKSCASSNKLNLRKPSTELLNINENAHPGPINVFEFDGLQILVPSTFISDSSQKAVSGTSQQSIASSENGAGNDEEVKSINMRADETMPPRGELSEQESNGCTEQSEWQVRSYKIFNFLLTSLVTY